MFGANEIVGRKSFKDAPVNSLLVTSIFYTLQGEGPYMGMPSIFIRLAKCNLACSFCDTYFDTGTWMTFLEIRSAIVDVLKKHWAPGDPPIWAMYAGEDSSSPVTFPGLVMVITGGEPMLQSNLLSFVEEEWVNWEHIQIETNGTQPIKGFSEYCTLVVSPKCNEKDGKPTHYLGVLPDVFLEADCFKFVLSADPDSPYNKIPDWALAFAYDPASMRVPVFVSPMNVYNNQPREMKITVSKGTPTLLERSTVIEKVSFWEAGLLDMKANQANHEYAARYAMKHGFRLNLQMHLYASIA